VHLIKKQKVNTYIQLTPNNKEDCIDFSNA